MLKRTGLSYVWGPSKSRVSNQNIRPLFKEAGATHLYAAKRNAQGHDTAREGASKMWKMVSRMLGERGTRYYIGGTALVALGLAGYMKKKHDMRVLEEGLAGLPKRHYKSRLTVVFDVDETLVSYGDKAYRLKAGVVPRPYLAELLDYLVSIDAEIILWSSCSEGYMLEVMSVLDPSQSKISTTITRDKSWYTADNYYEKNISWLKRDPANTLIVENRALSVRNCNANAILVDDFIRGEYVDTGADLPRNDRALRTIKEIVEDLERTGMAVPDYLATKASRHPDLKEIPCERAIRQLRDELARGVFYFVGDKYIPGSQAGRVVFESGKQWSK